LTLSPLVLKAGPWVSMTTIMFETWLTHKDDELAARTAAISRMDDDREAIIALLDVVRGPVPQLKLPTLDQG
jgi:hypothetical protein